LCTIYALEKDADFYFSFDGLYAKLGGIVPLYDRVRNYVTQKPFSTGKFKLNFENSTLLAGWDKNKEKDNWSVILRKGGNYYLGIMAKGNNKVFESSDRTETAESAHFEKLTYKLLPGPDKMLPKVFFSKKNIGHYNPSKEILNIRNSSSHTKNGTPQDGFTKLDFNLADCHTMIDFYKKSLLKHPEWSEYGFQFKPTEDYADLSEFYKDVADQGYHLTFEKVNKAHIDSLVESGKLYLFQIWSKDFSPYSKGKKNLHTIYWEEVFSEKNLADVVYKLNGEAELFYRRKSIEPRVTHAKNQAIANKDPIKGKSNSTFEYDIIKDRRYSEDKFFFHCPITLNFKSGKRGWEVNSKVNKRIFEKSKNLRILGIDRGERNLLSYTLIDSGGKILSQGSLNTISDDLNRSRDYKAKLDSLEGDRQEARRAWKNITNIKELKEGYISQIVYKISKIAIEENAIVVLEDLNFGFKRGRFKVEKQVYQKFEKALIDKLNYLVFKDRTEEEVGGPLRAYQLTNQFESFKKLGKQSGILYYVPASYTSKICPRTGFVNLLYPKYESVEKSKTFFGEFDLIRFNKGGGFFEFSFAYSKFGQNDDKELTRDSWTVCSNGVRLVNERKKETRGFETKEIDPTSELSGLFSKNGINFEGGGNIIEAITSQNDARFFKELTYLLKCILQLRNSRTGDDEDYILSCVKDKNGGFFDSRKAREGEPEDADTNGAYHIALKGLMLVERIKKQKDGKKKLDLKIDRNSFLNYAVSKAP
jgi:CRISPR-associated protein Cpf1